MFWHSGYMYKLYLFNSTAVEYYIDYRIEWIWDWKVEGAADLVIFTEFDFLLSDRQWGQMDRLFVTSHQMNLCTALWSAYVIHSSQMASFREFQSIFHLAKNVMRNRI